MDLENASARLAPRSPWQAVDLGTRLFRRWAWPVIRTWLAFTLIPYGLLLWLATSQEAWWPLLLFWWLKPLWERPLLAWYSHALFAEELSLRQLFRRWPRYALPGLFAQLTWRRFSPSRSFNTPVWQLEGARGQQLNQRLQVLHRAPSNRSWLMTVVMIHLEQFMSFALMALVYMLVPWQLNLELSDWFFEESNLQSLMASVCLYLAMCITEPLYVACGFSLYLNKRTWLEGWDLQLGLTRIGKARAGTSAAFALLVGALLLPTPPAQAQAQATLPADTKDEQQQVIELLAGDEYMPFDTCTYREWKHQDEDSEDSSVWETLWKKLFEWLTNSESRASTDKPFSIPSGLLWGIVWAVFAGVVVWLLLKVVNQMGFRLPGRQPQNAIPTHVAGLDIRRQSLPDDIASAVNACLQADDIRGALSLLLRASLATMLQRYPVPLAAGSTEQHCLRTLRQHHGSTPALQFLGDLINAWVRTAWAHRPVQAAEVKALLSRWQSLGQAETAHG